VRRIDRAIFSDRAVRARSPFFVRLFRPRVNASASARILGAMPKEPWAAALVVAIVLIASPSRAASTEDVYVQYEAGASCPTEASFEARLGALTSKATLRTLAPPNNGSTTLTVRLVSAQGRYEGRLSFHRASTGEVTERTVSSAACEDVVQALALVAALAIDPDTDPSLPVARPPNEPPAAPQTEAQSPARTSLPGRGKEPLDRGKEPRARAPYRSDLTIGSTLATAHAPSALAGVRVVLALTRDTEARVRGDAAVSLDVASSALTESDTTQGRFVLIAAAVRSCPLTLFGPPALEVALCGRARVGVVRANGRELARPETRAVAWAEAVVEGRVRASSPRRRGVFAEISAGLALHATRPSYYREVPFRSVYEVPLLGLDAGLSVGAYLP